MRLYGETRVSNSHTRQQRLRQKPRLEKPHHISIRGWNSSISVERYELSPHDKLVMCRKNNASRWHARQKQSHPARERGQGATRICPTGLGVFARLLGTIALPANLPPRYICTGQNERMIHSSSVPHRVIDSYLALDEIEKERQHIGKSKDLVTMTGSRHGRQQVLKEGTYQFDILKEY